MSEEKEEEEVGMEEAFEEETDSEETVPEEETLEEEHDRETIPDEDEERAEIAEDLLPEEETEVEEKPQAEVTETDLDAEIMADLEDFDAEDDLNLPKNAMEDADGIDKVETAEDTAETAEISESLDFSTEEAILTGQQTMTEDGQTMDDTELGEPDVTGEPGESIPPSNADLQADILEEERLSDEVDEEAKKKNIVEGALFVAGRPVSLEELNIKTEIRKRDLAEILKDLAMDYLMRPTALEIVQIQDKFSLQIKPEYTPNVKKFASGGLIPDKHLKTLTIIALKQPLLKSTLVKIRGSGAYDHVKFLLDRGFIEARRKGRSHELTTTEQFADTFGLSRDLPTLKKQMVTQLGIPEK